jgi:hypothetical protein
MYKPSTYLLITYFPTYLSTYIWDPPLSYRIRYQGETKY